MKIKNSLTIIIFFSIIIGFFIINFFDADEKISNSERRNLYQLPKIEFSNLSGFSNNFENYASDQFFKREEFRAIKNYIEFFVFKKQDIHSLSLYNDSIFKQEKINEKSIINAAKKMNDVYEKYLKNMNVYYTIIPDKSCYIPNEEGYLKYNFEEIEKIVQKNINNMSYIRIYDELNYDSYYKTDSHWKQEDLLFASNKIAKGLGNDFLNAEYKIKSIPEFYGVYYGQLQFKLSPDSIFYLTNDEIENCIVYNYETKKNTKVYDIQKSNSLDKYDIFLSGPATIQEITNPKVEEGKELIIFRDSFGSSITPLLIEKYNKITLIDLRYISSEVLEEYINFEEQDVIFMYSTLIFNNSFSIK